MTNTKKKKKNDLKNNTKSLLIIAILSIIVLAAGSTYAYWTWFSNNIVSFNSGNGVVIDLGDMGLTLNGNTTVTNLAPASCTNTRYSAIKAITISRYNATAFPADVTLTLSLTSFTWGAVKPSATNLANIKYALTTSASSCTSSLVTTTNNTGTLTGITVGSTKSTAQTQTTKLLDWTYTLPASSGSASSQVTETYYLYVWLDPAYTFQNVGNGTISDPLQNLSFQLTWSASTIQQKES